MEIKNNKVKLCRIVFYESVLRDYVPHNAMENGIPNKSNNQLLIQYFSDAVVVTDAMFTITAWNKAAENLFGYQENEVLGCNIRLLTPLDTRDAVTHSFIKNSAFKFCRLAARKFSNSSSHILIYSGV